ncbi:hypothetical protein D3877_12030 [Azospirillum cavernae]|uniref:Uncharacterized protein n=1 Tax=Azospirillum cavernae TaxID=2320860 RepID=A0A418VUY6_9PROT|nr:hypothetical protein D3877_12030 [Azospirillum cavernae]
MVAAEKAGRGGDRALGHLTPGELVVPLSCQTHELMALFARIAHQRGLNPNRFIVGSEEASRNPKTGLQEFLERDSGGVGDTGGRSGGGHGGGHDGDGASAGGDAGDGGVSVSRTSTPMSQDQLAERGVTSVTGSDKAEGFTPGALGVLGFNLGSRPNSEGMLGLDGPVADQPATRTVVGWSPTAALASGVGLATGLPVGFVADQFGLIDPRSYSEVADLGGVGSIRSSGQSLADQSVAGSSRGTGQAQASDQEDDPAASQRLRRRGLLTRRTA